MIFYFITGTLWSLWIESYTTRKLNAVWNISNRIFHIISWPVQVTIFIVTFINANRDNDDD